MQEQKMFDWKRFKKVQQNLPTVTKAGKGNFGSYMKLEDLNPKLLKVLNDNDFVWITKPSTIEGKPALSYQIVDTLSGASIDGEMLLSMEKDTPQGQGSGITYARRYSLSAITGMVADLDDDGQAGSKLPTDTDKDMDVIIKMVDNAKGKDELRKMYANLSPTEKKIALPLVQEKIAETEVA